jgi:hypothetical protein
MLNSKGDSLLPLFVRHKTFEHMVEGGYLSLLEGFSRVPFCSTEGRSLMSMDLSSFENGIRTESIMERVNFDSSIVPPTPVIVERGKEYVDAYVKVFYFPEDVRLSCACDFFCCDRRERTHLIFYSIYITGHYEMDSRKPLELPNAPLLVVAY